MKIEITNFDTKELIQVLKAFPVGKVVVTGSNAYWDSTNKLPDGEFQQVQQSSPQQQQRPKQQDFFGNMKKSLFEAFE
jgi:hypothetical protein